MRSALLASLALTLTLTQAFAPSIADACGGYRVDLTPRMFAVQTHGDRAFVLLAPTARPVADWTALAPDTFDWTETANETRAAAPTAMTLIGPAGATVVTSDRHLVITRQWKPNLVFSALEVTAGADARFQVAVSGVHRDATWRTAGALHVGPQTLKTARSHGLDTAYVQVTKIQGTPLQVITGHKPDDIDMTSIIVRGASAVGRSVGRPIGAIEVGGSRYVLFERDGLITPVAA